jgi:hypothetical protein
MKSNKAKICELLNTVSNDPSAAIELLKYAADYLKKRNLMPEELADYLARAFNLTASTPEPENGRRIEDVRIARLANGLGMLMEGGRPRKNVPKGDVVLTVAVYGDAVSETQLSKGLRDAYKGTKHKIGLSTARKRIQDAKSELAKAADEVHKIMKSKNIKSLVRTRNIKEN